MLNVRAVNSYGVYIYLPTYLPTTTTDGNSRYSVYNSGAAV